MPKLNEAIKDGVNAAVTNRPGKSFGTVFVEKKKQLDNLQSELAAAIMPSIPGMPAGKFFDMGLGVDFHSTIIPPSPLCAVPDVNMVYDLFTMLFVAINTVMPDAPEEDKEPEMDENGNPVPQPVSVASVARAIVTMMQPTLKINNQWVANAGVGIQHLPAAFVHGPAPTVAPMAQAEMFMGSSTVLADGAPFSYQFLPALSCNLVGIPPPFRLKSGKPKMTLMAPSASLVGVLPLGAAVLVGGPPTIDLFALGITLGLKGMGKLWKHGGGALFEAFIKKVNNKFGSKYDDFLRRMKCFWFGEPVDVATGRVYSENEDFSFGGPIPLQWNRIYFSDSDTKSPLGRGWHHSYDLYHSKAEDGIILLKLSDGRTLPMPQLIPSDEFYHPIEKLFWSFNGQHYTLIDENGLHYIFENTGNSTKTSKVTLIKNATGNSITLKYNNDQQLTTIIDSVGRIFKLSYNHTFGLLEKVELLNDDYHSIWQHAYVYNEDQLLHKVIDVQNATKTFEYKDGLLVHLENQLGLNFYWEYQIKDNKARCIHTWGDEGILEYHAKYEKGKTIVTNSLGHTTTYHYTPGLLINKIIDPLGNITINKYNKHQELVLTIDPMGNSTKFAYNKQNMLVKEENAFGNSQKFSYDKQNRLLTSTTYGGATFKRILNENGQATEIDYPNGNTLELNYQNGKLHQLIDQDQQITTLSWDSKHNLSQITAPNGTVSTMEYDFFGQLIKAKSPNGAITSYQYDLVGNVLELIEPTGSKHTFTYDNGGNVLSANDGNRQVEFTYWGLGNLKTRKENGRLVKFTYDTEEQLKSIINEGGEAYRFLRDGNGAIIGEWGFDGLSRQYTRNLNGQVTAVNTPSTGATNYKYNPLGQVIAVNYPDHSYELYNYNKDGALIEATNANNQVLLKRDKTGQILEELQNGHCIKHSYNAFGQRTQLESSLGANIKHNYNVLGQLTQTTAQQTETKPWQAGYSYDMMGYEIERNLNGIQQKTQRDIAGRVTQQLVHNKNVEYSRRQYFWNPANQLQKLIKNGEATDFSYDLVGNLASASYKNGIETIYKTSDAIGNLYNNRDKKGYTYNKGGKLIEDPNYTYEYNDLGFLTQKTSKNDRSKRFSVLIDEDSNNSFITWNYHWYANGNLQKVTNNDGIHTEYKYDALGRRTAVIKNNTLHRSIYDGNVLLHEFNYSLKDKPQLVIDQQGVLSYDKAEPVNNLITWVFNEGSFVPQAKIVNGETYSIISDHLGTPVEAYNTEGKKVWSCELDIYGKAINFTGSKTFIPFRYQGQYEDEETGLYYNRFRYYSPDSGTYISQDPIRLESGEPNFYSYVRDINSEIDPFGEAGMPWHHLIPQEMFKNADFMQQLNQVTGGNAKNYIHRQGAFVEEGLHKVIHKGAGGGKWNDTFKKWAKDADYDFTKKSLQNQLKKMMKDNNIPKSSRNFARKYKRKTKTKFKCKG